MRKYYANSVDSYNCILRNEAQQNIGELIYTRWYSFSAEINLFNKKKYKLDPKDFWQSKIELKDGTNVLLEFKMGWNGIIIKTFFDKQEKSYLLKSKGILSSTFLLLDTQNNEVLAAEPNFRWTKLSYDYTIETTQIFDDFKEKELIIFTTLHCINYYMSVSVGAM